MAVSGGYTRNGYNMLPSATVTCFSARTSLQVTREATLVGAINSCINGVFSSAYP